MTTPTSSFGEGDLRWHPALSSRRHPDIGIPIEAPTVHTPVGHAAGLHPDAGGTCTVSASWKIRRCRMELPDVAV
jgi:hypothetical protein